MDTIRNLLRGCKRMSLVCIVSIACAMTVKTAVAQTVDSLDSFGGAATDAALSDPYAMVAVGAHVYMVDLRSSVGQFDVVSVSDQLPATIIDVEHQDRRVFATTRDMTLVALSAPDSTRLETVGTYDVGEPIRDIALFGESVILLVGRDSETVLLVVDASSPSEMIIASRYSEFGDAEAYQIYQSSGIVHVALGEAGVASVDVTEPHEPTLVSWSEDLPAQVIAGDGQSLVVKWAGARNGGAPAPVLLTGTISEEGQVSRVGSYSLSHETDVIPNALALAGDVVFSRSNTALDTYRLDEDGKLTKAGNTRLSRTPVLAGDISVHDGQFLTAIGAREIYDDALKSISCGGQGVIRVDVEDIGFPHESGAWISRLPGQARSVVDLGNVVATGDRCGVSLHTINDDGEPVYRATIDSDDSTILFRAGTNILGFYDASNVLSLNDVSNPRVPVEVDSTILTAGSDGGFTLFRATNDRLIAGTGVGVIHGFILSGGERFRRMWRVELSNSPSIEGMSVSSDYLYVVGTDYRTLSTVFGLWIVDIRNDDAPFEVGFLEIPFRPRSVVADSHSVYIAAQTEDPAVAEVPDGLLWTVDVSSVSSPERVGKLTRALGSTSQRRGWSIASDNNGLTAISAMDSYLRLAIRRDGGPASLLYEARLPDVARALDMNANRVVVANGDGGLAIARLRSTSRTDDSGIYLPLALTVK